MSTPKTSGYEHLWRRSSPPIEDFSTSSSTGELWGYEIVGEEIDGRGQSEYEVRWEGWSRPDNTQTTWHSAFDSDIDTSIWDEHRQKNRNRIASESLAIDIQSTTDFHNSATYEHHQALSEKIVLSRRNPPNQVAEMMALMEYHRSMDNPESLGDLDLPPSLDNPSAPVQASERMSSRRQSVLSSTIAGSSRSPSVPTISTRGGQSTPKRRRVVRSESVSTDAEGSASECGSDQKQSNLVLSESLSSEPTVTFMEPADYENVEIEVIVRNGRRLAKCPRCKQEIGLGTAGTGYIREIHLLKESCTLAKQRLDAKAAVKVNTELGWCQLSREQLRKKWSQAAKRTGAAPINFCNMVDNEEIPKLSSSFKYLEASYNFADDVERPQDEGFLMTCDCEMCEDADICGCQGESQVVDHTTNSKVYAYHPSGKYKFNASRGVEVIECNKNCNCGPSSCPNRVSQKPRDVPIEIFKTDERGWGVRSPMAIKRGKVLGIYTGLVIHRKSYIGLSDNASMYIFDLDGDEESGTEDHVPHQLYSVDAMHQGNWTRFINHSCSPNLVVYLVVHDIPSGIGMPFIAFVASRDIPAMTEFTLDYDPKAAEELAAAKASGKGKKKAKQAYLPQSGDHRCSCGSTECRGYMP